MKQTIYQIIFKAHQEAHQTGETHLVLVDFSTSPDGKSHYSSLPISRWDDDLYHEHTIIGIAGPHGSYHSFHPFRDERLAHCCRTVLKGLEEFKPMLKLLPEAREAYDEMVSLLGQTTSP